MLTEELFRIDPSETYYYIGISNSMKNKRLAKDDFLIELRAINSFINK
ncbi:hypothetical protein ANABIO32_32110 [Rossellomorea marisflavi]|nr:hypothetical protein ANABIO32_32110 [Rossellomorea marisflavi]